MNLNFHIHIQLLMKHKFSLLCFPNIQEILINCLMFVKSGMNALYNVNNSSSKHN